MVKMMTEAVFFITSKELKNHKRRERAEAKTNGQILVDPSSFEDSGSARTSPNKGMVSLRHQKITGGNSPAGLLSSSSRRPRSLAEGGEGGEEEAEEDARVSGGPNALDAAS